MNKGTETKSRKIRGSRSINDFKEFIKTFEIGKETEDTNGDGHKVYKYTFDQEFSTVMF